MRVVVSAYACSPYKGSEYGVGWGWVQAAARYHEIWVLTAAHNRPDIERRATEAPEEFRRVQFCYVPHRLWYYRPTPFWEGVANCMLSKAMNLPYRLWQRKAYELGGKLHQRIGFDLVHLLTYVGFRFPGHLWKLNIPFVWGPIGGLENTPWRLLPILGPRGCIYYAGRNVINSLHKRLLQSPKWAFRKARGGIIAATADMRDEIKRFYGEDSEVICEVGPLEEVATEHSRRELGEPLRIAWSGSHRLGKALPLLLHALARLADDVAWHLDVLGDGPCTPAWRAKAESLGMDGRCTWHGRLAREDAVALVHRAHVFVITSMIDLTSTVLLEALSQGVPVICPDHCGFADVVTADCGIKVPVVSPRQLAGDMTAAIAALAEDEPRRQHLATGALRRIRDFSWDQKARRLDTIYRRAATRGLATPSGPPSEGADVCA
ncbi:MAG TPA: glycosyltransferase [Phycisphaerae bacterium]|nr:glycosyltransferase [Phycisphaerae bacterium]